MKSRTLLLHDLQYFAEEQLRISGIQGFSIRFQVLTRLARVRPVAGKLVTEWLEEDGGRLLLQQDGERLDFGDRIATQPSTVFWLNSATWQVGVITRYMELRARWDSIRYENVSNERRIIRNVE